MPAREPVTWGVFPHELGTLTLAVTSRGLCYMAFGGAGEASKLAARLSWAALHRDEAQLAGWFGRAAGVIEGWLPMRTITLDMHGTKFQQRVWSALCNIPFGHTMTYGEVAARLGQPKGARAIARGCATNPVAPLVPCHRVVGGSGALGGYSGRGGIPTKKRLLAWEAARLTTCEKAAIPA